MVSEGELPPERIHHLIREPELARELFEFVDLHRRVRETHERVRKYEDVGTLLDPTTMTIEECNAYISYYRWY